MFFEGTLLCWRSVRIFGDEVALVFYKITMVFDGFRGWHGTREKGYPKNERQ